MSRLCSRRIYVSSSHLQPWTLEITLRCKQSKVVKDKAAGLRSTHGDRCDSLGRANRDFILKKEATVSNLDPKGQLRR